MKSPSKTKGVRKVKAWGLYFSDVNDLAGLTAQFEIFKTKKAAEAIAKYYTYLTVVPVVISYKLN